MMHKLIAIWRILKSEHFAAITVDGITSSTPRDYHDKILNIFIDRLERIRDGQKKEIQEEKQGIQK